MSTTNIARLATTGSNVFTGELTGTTATFSGTIQGANTILSNGTEANLKFISDGTGGDQAAIYVQKGTGNGVVFAEENRDFIWRTGVAALTGGGGTQVMRLTNSGNLGIGNSGPQGLLQIGINALSNNSDASNAFNLKQTSTTAATGIYLERSGERRGYYMYIGGSLDSLTFQRNNVGTKADVMSLTRDGNVGIGTDSPNERLQVSGAISATGTATTAFASSTTMDYFSGGTRFISRGDNNSTRGQYTFKIESADGSLSINPLIISTTGVATFSSSVSANSLLVERTVSRNMLGISSISLPTSGDEEGVAVIKTNSSIWQLSTVGYAADSKGVRFYNNGGTGHTAFQVEQSGGTRFIINGVGNVGIGTDSPDVKLSISGTAGNVTTDIGNGNLLELYGGTISSANNGVGIRFTRAGSQMGFISAARENASDEAGFLSFASQTSTGTHPERMRITSTGTVQPGANGTQDLGTSSLRWATVFTSDLSLSNGIGDYTIVEGENDLFLYNNKQNKVYKFVIEEVNPSTATPKKS
jgi:hypothetical protein